MAQKKGQTGNPKGRPKGKPNKVTSELKSWIQQIIDGNRGKFEEDLEKLEPKDRLMIIEKLMNYVVPKQQAISVEAQVQAEYAELEKLLDKAPEKVVDALLERMNNLINKDNED
ncbi:DUF5681 domain-containing protein [Dysgonomonas capnocytophagoides]|uniref:DUF5681 domain-containing protein n=1 Tax=Dysgonomonas capnocytophagoides TaxID=45254 RepID=UPI0033419690